MMKTKTGLVLAALMVSLVVTTGCRQDSNSVVTDTASSQPAIPAAKLTLIQGNCEGGRELGDPASYALRLRAKDNSLGFIRVRREAKWPAENLSNVLGTVPCGTTLWGQGPLKNADDEGSCGIGYAVAVRDSQGRQCRGYVSYTVVERLDEHGHVLPGP